MKDVLFTVMYGNNKIYELELFGSALSALSLCKEKPIEILVYSDRDSIDGFPLPVTVVPIDSNDWNKWTHNGSITHLIKMHAMKDALERCQGRALYFDTDTIFRTRPAALLDRIDPQHSLMHAEEGTLREHSFWEEVIETLSQRPSSTLSSRVNHEARMFNSGVMGMHYSQAPLIDEAIDLAETIYAILPIFSIDQFSTGSVLGENTMLGTCEQDILHYWGWKRHFIHRELTQIKQYYLDRSPSNTTVARMFRQMKIDPKIDIRDRLLSYIYRKTGNDVDSFADITYRSALRNIRSDPEQAILWINACLTVYDQMIANREINRIPEESIKQFFKIYSDSRLLTDKDTKARMESICSTLTGRA